MDDRKEDVSPYLLRPLRCVEEVLAERAKRERATGSGARARPPRLKLIHDTLTAGAKAFADRS